jgi:hypothetical protein
MKECTHTPRCIDKCRACGQPLPEFLEPSKNTGERNNYVVHFENGSKCYIHDQLDSDEAKLNCIISTARAAGLCLDHMVRVVKVEKGSYVRETGDNVSKEGR